MRPQYCMIKYPTWLCSSYQELIIDVDYLKDDDILRLKKYGITKLIELL